MPSFLSACLFLSAGIYAAGCLCRYPRIHMSQAMLYLVTLISTAVAAVPVLLISKLSYHEDDLLMILMVIMVFLALWRTGERIRILLSAGSRAWFCLLLVYLTAILIVTLFTRDHTNNTEVLLSFGKLTDFLQTGNPEGFLHVILNICMTVPFGFLVCALIPGRTDRVSLVLPAGLMMTVLIEASQYLFRIGQCDLEDIVGNTLGALIGFICYRFYRHLSAKGGPENG